MPEHKQAKGGGKMKGRNDFLNRANIGTAIITGVVTAAVTIGGSVFIMGGKLNELQEARSDIAELQGFKSNLVFDRIPEVEQDLNSVRSDLTNLRGTLGLDRLEERSSSIDDGLKSVETYLGNLQAELARITERYELLLERDREHREEHSDIRSELRTEVEVIVADLSRIKEKTGKIEGILTILEPLVREGLALGRITTEDLKAVYTEAEVNAFVKDVIHLIEEEGERKPRGGGGGYGGESHRGLRVTVDGGTYKPIGTCDGPPEDCLYTSWTTGSAIHETRIEIHLNTDGDRLADIVRAWQMDERWRVDAAEFEGTICQWVAQHHRDAELESSFDSASS